MKKVSNLKSFLINYEQNIKKRYHSYHTFRHLNYPLKLQWAIHTLLKFIRYSIQIKTPVLEHPIY